MQTIQTEAETRKRPLSDDEACLPTERGQSPSNSVGKNHGATRKEYEEQSLGSVDAKEVHFTSSLKKRRTTIVWNRSCYTEKQQKKREDKDSEQMSMLDVIHDAPATGSLHPLFACALAYEYFCSVDEKENSNEAAKLFCGELDSRELCNPDPPLSLLQGPTALCMPDVVNPTQAALLLAPASAAYRRVIHGRFKSIWEFAPYVKHATLLWLIMHQAIWTAERAKKIGKGNGKCSRCNRQDENVVHLFLECEFTQPFINILWLCCKSLHPFPFRWQEILLGECRGLDLVFWNKIRAIYLFHVWKHRNAWLFKDQNRNFVDSFKFHLRLVAEQAKQTIEDAFTKDDAEVREILNQDWRRWDRQLSKFYSSKRLIMCADTDQATFPGG